MSVRIGNGTLISMRSPAPRQRSRGSTRHGAAGVPDRQKIHRLVKSDALKPSRWPTGCRPSRLMPSYLLPDEQGRLVGLEDLLEEGPVAIALSWLLVPLLPHQYR